MWVRRGLHSVALLPAVGVLAVIATGTGSCIGVLGLDDYSDAIEALCQCSQQLPPLQGECREVLSARLAGASAENRAAWLAFYSDTCADSCQRAAECYAMPGTCSNASCASHQECCGFSAAGAKGASCSLGTSFPRCEACSNSSCSSDADCCSFQRGEGSCDIVAGVCQEDPR